MLMTPRAHIGCHGWARGLPLARWLALIATLTVDHATHARAVVTIEVIPNVIEMGQASRLSWNAPGAGEVYVTSIGSVGPIGAADVHPRQTMAFVVIAAIGDGLEVATTSVHVRNAAKGALSGLPPNDDFQCARGGTVSVRSLPRAMKAIRDLLDEVSDGAVAEIVTATTYRFATPFRLEEVPTGTDEGRKSIRYAYAVTLPNVNMPANRVSELPFEIQVFLQRRRRKERTWYSSKDDPLCRHKAEIVQKQVLLVR